MLRILPIVLLLSHLLGSDLRRIADPNFKVELRQQALEPARVSGSLDSHPYHCPQLAIDLLSFSAMRQPPFSAFSCFRVHPSDLLHARVIIAASSFENAIEMGMRQATAVAG